MEKEIIEIDDTTETCPVCESLISCDLLIEHVEKHFKTDNEWRICHRCGNKVPGLQWDDHIYAHGVEEAKPKPNQLSSDIASTTVIGQGTFCKPVVVNEWSDEMLACALQEQEMEDVKKEKQKEQEEFQRLQSLYGINSKSGYAKQYNQSLDRDVSQNKLSMADYFSRKANMLVTLMTGEESDESCTQGVLEKLQEHIRESGPSGSEVVILCSPTNHYPSTYGDKNWGCGYRNLQMLLSALIKIEGYKNTVSKVCKNVPSIPKIQQLIEDAWQEGFDQQGASQLDYKLRNSKKWIGATEVAVAMKYMGLRTQIVDFHQPTAPDGTHMEMFYWIKRYFNRCLEQHSTSPSHITPLYIQHQGHSRLVIGFEEKFNKSRNQNLLLFDPACCQRQMQRLLEKGKGINLTILRKSRNQMKSQQYQIVYVDGIMTDEERKKSKVLTSTRIP